MPQSAVSAYENGGREPSLPVLRRLVAAAGFELDVGLSEGRPHAAAFSGPTGVRVQPRRAALRAWLSREGWGRPQVFGSVSRGDDGPDSDLDLLVDVPEGTGLLALASARRRASEIAGVPVDLVPRGSLRGDIASSVEPETVPL